MKSPRKQTAKPPTEDMRLTEQECPVCGLPRDEWFENAGQGVERGGLVFCSTDCAERSEYMTDREPL